MSGSFLRCPDCSALLDDESLPCPRCGRLPETAAVVAEPTPVAAVAPLQEAAAYRPSGRSDPGAAPRLWLSGLIGALVVGSLYALVTHFFDLFLIFPMLAGLGIGAMLAPTIKRRHVRAPMFAATVGVVAGVLAYGLAFVVGIYVMRPMMVQAMSQDIAQQSGATLAQTQAWVEKRLDPVTTLRLGAQIQVDNGVNIKNNGVGSGISVSGGAYIGLMILEALLMGGTAAGVALSAAKQPYCEGCRQWQQQSRIFLTQPGRAPEVVQAARAQDWGTIARIKSEMPGTDKNYCAVEVNRCPACDDARLHIKTLANKTSKNWLQAQLPVEAVRTLEQAGYLPPARVVSA